MNYQIIKDIGALQRFIKWLPDLTETEKFYCCLFARSKYLKDENGVNRLPHIKTDKAQLKRFVSDKERLFQKIKQLEIEKGWYFQKQHVIPQEALALYITVNPRDMYKASINTLVKLATSVRDQNVLMNPHQEALSEIQRTKSRTVYIDFDIDEDREEHLKVHIEEMRGYINFDAVTFLKTRGGIHALVDPLKVAQEYKSSFYKNMSRFVDQAGDIMIPVPGCVQGDFVPHFVNY